MDKPKVTAVLLNWRRPDNIPVIVDRLAHLPFVVQVVVWDNSNSTSECWPAYVVRSPDGRNWGVYARFVVASATATEWIITQDDDCQVNNWPEIYEAALAHPDVITSNTHMNEDDRYGGTIPVRSPKPPKRTIGWDVYIGWGSMFRKALIGDIFERYIARWGEDDCLRRDADRIFCVAQGTKPHTLQARTENLPGIDGPMAIHKDGRADLTQLARRRAAEMVTESRR